LISAFLGLNIWESWIAGVVDRFTSGVEGKKLV
jgi:hypothetical protein